MELPSEIIDAKNNRDKRTLRESRNKANPILEFFTGYTYNNYSVTRGTFNGSYKRFTDP